MARFAGGVLRLHALEVAAPRVAAAAMVGARSWVWAGQAQQVLGEAESAVLFFLGCSGRAGHGEQWIVAEFLAHDGLELLGAPSQARTSSL
jgi:hypothetical protein